MRTASTAVAILASSNHNSSLHIVPNMEKKAAQNDSIINTRAEITPAKTKRLKYSIDEILGTGLRDGEKTEYREQSHRRHERAENGERMSVSTGGKFLLIFHQDCVS